MADKLTFKIAPHIVEDLGLNLYTTMPRVLVEFVANAYDADSPYVDIVLDHDRIRRARDIVKQEFELERAKQSQPSPEPLETRVLADDISITVTDSGHGMSRDELNQKFLFAGRRRRQEEPQAKARSPNGRPLMGRKGLGKLAGFGVAKIIEVTTRKAGETHATRITLNYDKLIEKHTVHEIEVPDEKLTDGGGLAPSGTRIKLTRLL